MSDTNPGLLRRLFGAGPGGASIQSDEAGGQGVTRTLLLTDQWQAIPSLTAGTVYMFQNRSPYNCFFDIGTGAPTSDRFAFVIGTNSFIILRPEASENIYARGATSGGYLIFTKHHQQ